MRAEIDLWNGSKATMKISECLDATAVVKLMQKLDGEKHTLVNVTLLDGCLMLGGGPNEYVVVVQNVDGSSRSLKNGKCDEGLTKNLNVGGQIGDYPAEIVVEQALAINAIKVVLGVPNEYGLQWIED